MFVLLLAISTAPAATWTVDATGSADFTTIQQAIDAASSGDLIDIAAGTYGEAVDLSGKDLELAGAGAMTTTIGGLGLATCLTAEAGETLVASDLSLAGCDALISASAATLQFTDVDLWGSADAGTVDAADFTWRGGIVEYILGTGLEVGSSSLTWSDLDIQYNELEGSLLRCQDCDVAFSDLIIADNGTGGSDDGEAYGLLDLPGGTAWIEDLSAYDNQVADDCSGLLDFDEGNDAVVLNGLFYDNTLDSGKGLLVQRSDNGTLETELCVFEELERYALSGSVGEAYVSIDDLFDVSGTGDSPYAIRLGGGGTVVLEGTVFTGYPAGSKAIRLNNSGGSSLSGIALDQGYLSCDDSIEIRDSSFLGEEALVLDDCQATVSSCSFAGTGGTAITADEDDVLEDLSIYGYETAITGPIAVAGSSFEYNTYLVSPSGSDRVAIRRSSIVALNDGIQKEDGGLILEDVTIEAGARGLDITRHAEVSISDVTITASSYGIDIGGTSAFEATGLILEAQSDGIRIFLTDRRCEPSVLLEDSSIDSQGGHAIWVGSGANPDLDLYRTELTATDAGLYTVDYGPSVYLEGVAIDAGGNGLDLAAGSGSYVSVSFNGLSIDAGGGGIANGGSLQGEGMEVRAGGDCISTWRAVIGDLDLECAGAGLLASDYANLEGATIQPGNGECVVADGCEWQDVTCIGAGGERPLDLSSCSSLSDVLVKDCSSSQPSRIAGGSPSIQGLRFENNSTAADAGALELENVRLSGDGLHFLDNTAAEGVGALQVIDSAISATNLYFAGNSGTTVGALSLDGESSLDLQGAVFRENTASDGPGALLDESGASIACALFQENSGAAGDAQLTNATAELRNCSFVGSQASASGSLYVDASYATLYSSIFAQAQAGYGIYADGTVRTAFFLYNDVYGNAAGQWGGGVTSPTGTNGNLEVDPLFVAYSADGDPSNDDLSLAAGSPLIDAGHPSWTDEDGSTSDMGAYGSDCAGLLDYDGDGQNPAGGDCDDHDASLHGEADEICDGMDNDCDGLIDEDDPDLADAGWYWDGDGDGYGSDEQNAALCSKTPGYVALGGDCDDADPAIHPGAEERCDGVDEDCDGVADDDPVDGVSWYADSDGDGYGDADSRLRTCADQPNGYVADSSDCDDQDPKRHDTALWHRDADGDGYGDPHQPLEQCEQPKGYVSDSSDCDDGDASVHPGATEAVGDGIDQDCDGEDPLVALSALLTGDLLFTEIMPKPYGLIPSGGCWVEIWNDSGVNVDVEGLRVDSYVVQESLLLVAGGRLVLGSNDDLSNNGGVPVDYELNNFLLDYDTQGLILDDGELVFDEVWWGDCGAFPCPTGASLSLSPEHHDAELNDDGANWCVATSTYGDGGKGTPGAPNDPCGADTGLDSGHDSPSDDTGGAERGGCREGCAVRGGVGPYALLALLCPLLVLGRRRASIRADSAPPG